MSEVAWRALRHALWACARPLKPSQTNRPAQLSPFRYAATPIQRLATLDANKFDPSKNLRSALQPLREETSK